MTYLPHPLADIFPMMDDADAANLPPTTRDVRRTRRRTLSNSFFAVRPLIACAALMCLTLHSAFANDSTAELAAGGLVFSKSNDVEMRSELLYISTKEIRVNYRFFNKSSKKVTTTVAFPTPDIDASGDYDVAIPTDDPVNVLGFSTVVDGKSVNSLVEQRVFVKNVEHTNVLRRLNVPLNPVHEETSKVLNQIPREHWDDLVKLGLVVIEEQVLKEEKKDVLRAVWTVKTTYHWQQNFPAQKEIVITHRYKPSVGSAAGTGLELPDQSLDYYKKQYCMDDRFVAAFRKKKLAKKQIYFTEEWVTYILKTGANWAGPIKDFHLIVDKGDAENLVSFCSEGVRKIDGTKFEVKATNFVPTSDLRVLILKPAR